MNEIARLKRSILDNRKPIKHVPARAGVPGTGQFGSPAVDIYACVGCGCDIHYHPDGLPTPLFPPPELCGICQYRLGYLDFGHTFDEESQPESTAESVTGRKCVICETSIDHLRPQAVTCSPKCRKALSRKKIG